MKRHWGRPAPVSLPSSARVLGPLDRAPPVPKAAANGNPESRRACAGKFLGLVITRCHPHPLRKPCTWSCDCARDYFVCSTDVINMRSEKRTTQVMFMNSSDGMLGLDSWVGYGVEERVRVRYESRDM